MKRALIIGGAVVGVIIIAIVVVLVVVVGNIDSIVKDGVETYGSEMTQAKVTLDEVDISATSGEGKLGGLTIGNPRGFKTDSGFKLGGVKVSLDVGSVAGDTVIIREIVIDAPQVTYEVGGAAGSNIDAIHHNINAYLGKPAKGGKAASAPSKEDKDGKKLIIENLYIRDGKVGVSATFLQGRKLGAPLPSIHLKDIGKKEGGASPGEVAEQVMKAVSDAATKAVASLNVKGLIPDVGKVADEAQKAVEKELEGVTKGLGGAGETPEKTTEGVGKALKGLFGK